MILFPNAKINLGLRVLRRRCDGYHDIATVMYPIGWCDILEIVPARADGTFAQAGHALDCQPEKNLVLKAISRLEDYVGHPLPPLDIRLEKHIPFGAGLGGGSSDAAFALRGANEVLGLGLDKGQLAAVAARVGADCPFFIYNEPMLATGIGEILEPVDAGALSGMWLLVAKPQSEAVSTAQAYSAIVPRDMGRPADLALAVAQPVARWAQAGVLVNDFEPAIFGLRPEIARIKSRMLADGADYAAMSGSGAAVFGLFADVKMAERACEALRGCATHLQKLN